MTASHVLADLRRRGLRVAADGPEIVIRGPRDALTPDVVAAVRSNKANLLAILNVAAEPNRRRPRYAHPWPDGLPGLGMRLVGPFDVCDSCGEGTWVRYGTMVLCLACAQELEDAAPAMTTEVGADPLTARSLPPYDGPQPGQQRMGNGGSR